MRDRSDPLTAAQKNRETPDADERRAVYEVAIETGLLRSVLDAGNAVGWDWDVRNGSLVWFGNLHTMFGIASTTFVGRMEDFRARVHPEDRDFVSAAVADAMKRRAAYAGIFRVMTLDARVRWVSSRGEFVFGADGSAERMLGISIDITERRNTEQALATFGRRLIETQEAERVRVARELHDDVGQRLALLSVALDRLFQSGVGSYEDVREQLIGLQTVVQSLSHELHATPLRHLGLSRAVRGYCAEIASAHAVDVSVHESGDLDAIGPDVSLCLFRVLQESLRNAIRHTGGRQFAVELSGEPHAVWLNVRDYGAGFDPSASTSVGLGLISMRERLKLVNGELTIDSGIGGTLVRARVPRTARADWPDR
jgi:PAS domain S-box-containing protein